MAVKFVTQLNSEFFSLPEIQPFLIIFIQI